MKVLLEPPGEAVPWGRGLEVSGDRPAADTEESSLMTKTGGWSVGGVGAGELIASLELSLCSEVLSLRVVDTGGGSRGSTGDCYSESTETHYQEMVVVREKEGCLQWGCAPLPVPAPPPFACCLEHEPGEGGATSGCACGPGFPCPPCAQTGGGWCAPPRSRVTPACGPGGGAPLLGLHTVLRVCPHVTDRQQSAQEDAQKNGSRVRTASRKR